MNIFYIKEAIWLYETVNILKNIKDDAKNRTLCKDELKDEIGTDVYYNVKCIITEAIDKINLEFEKL